MTAAPLRYLSLFSGIGGFDLGFDRAGMTCAGQVEIDPFCQKVLAKHWPDVKRMADIREVKGDEFGTIDVICGGFPCQPHSVAGKRRGAADDRDLWPEYRRLVAAIRPAWVVGENVPGIRTTILDYILSDLENLGYTSATFIIPACAFDAPHIRERVFILARSVADPKSGGRRFSYPQHQRANNGKGYTSRNGGAVLAHANSERRNGRAGEFRPGWGRQLENGYRWEPEPGVGGSHDGLPAGLDRLGYLISEPHECILTNGFDLLGDIHHAESEERGTGEVLRLLRGQAGTQAIRGSIGGLDGFQASEVLQSQMRKQQEASATLGNPSLACPEASQGILRSVWHCRKFACSSCRRELSERRDREHSDTLRLVSQLLACDCGSTRLGATWQDAFPNVTFWSGDWERGIPRIANKIPRRVDRLRALGNAVVPQVTEWLGRRIIEATP